MCHKINKLENIDRLLIMSSISLNISSRPENLKKNLFSGKMGNHFAFGSVAHFALGYTYIHTHIYNIRDLCVCVCVCVYKILGAFLVAQQVARSATQEILIWFLGREDTLEKG